MGAVSRGKATGGAQPAQRTWTLTGQERKDET
jgi:hypothetical protein